HPSEVGEGELRRALEDHAWQLKAAAAALGVSRTSLYTLIERHPHLRTAARLDRNELAEALDRHGGDFEAAAAELQVSAHALQRRASDLGLDR
ncbi:MAG: helix-turn-helix domain-containing protein, partial [Acidobacteriota bacterium]